MFIAQHQSRGLELLSSVCLSSRIVGEQSIAFLIRMFGHMVSLNLNFWVMDRYRFIIIPNSVHLGDTLLVSREKVATCSKNKAHATVPGLGICTVAIINKPDVPQAYWPGPSLGVEPKTDVASYDEIYYALRAVGDHCLTLRSEVGWVLAGQLYLPFVAGSGNILTKIGW